MQRCGHLRHNLQGDGPQRGVSRMARKHPPKTDYRTLRFKDYLKAGIAAPPAYYNVLDTVYQNLKIKDPTKLFPVDGNDQIGDCTIAAMANAINVYRGLLMMKRMIAHAAVQQLSI